MDSVNWISFRFVLIFIICLFSISNELNWWCISKIDFNFDFECNFSIIINVACYNSYFTLVFVCIFVLCNRSISCRPSHYTHFTFFFFYFYDFMNTHKKLVLFTGNDTRWINDNHFNFFVYLWSKWKSILLSEKKMNSICVCQMFEVTSMALKLQK